MGMNYNDPNQERKKETKTKPFIDYWASELCGGTTQPKYNSTKLFAILCVC